MARATTSGLEVAALSRRQVETELERLRRAGVAQAAYLLSLVTEENYQDVWPYVQPLMGLVMQTQQDGARRILQGYFVGIALAVGVAVALNSKPDINSLSAYRNGLLPSGMPWSRLISTVPTAIQHRVENGMSLRDALQRSKATLLVAANSQAFAEERNAAVDVLQDTSRYSPGMQQLIKEERERKERMPAIPAGDVDDNWRPADTIFPVRYIRQPNPGACSWCLLLATKGAIFRSRETARSAGHNNCRCQVYPEPSPGAWRNKVLLTPAELEGKVWRDVKRDVTYDLASLAAKSERIGRQVMPMPVGV